MPTTLLVLTCEFVCAHSIAADAVRLAVRTVHGGRHFWLQRSERRLRQTHESAPVGLDRTLCGTTLKGGIAGKPKAEQVFGGTLGPDHGVVYALSQATR